MRNESPITNVYNLKFKKISSFTFWLIYQRHFRIDISTESVITKSHAYCSNV